MRIKERSKVITPEANRSIRNPLLVSALMLAACGLFAGPAEAQKSEAGPSLSVFRSGVGIVRTTESKRSSLFSIAEGQEPVVGDFDADGRTDTGVFDAVNRLWTVRRSGDGSTLTTSFSVQERKSHIRLEPAPADLDGDGETDLVVFCGGAWHVPMTTKPGSVETIIFGKAGDIPVPADYDGDGKADLAVFRPSENRWHILSSATGGTSTFDFGVAGTDTLIPADYTGDGKADITVYRQGVWHMIDSESGAQETFEFGFENGRPAAIDFDRDGRMDFAVYRKGTWYVYDGSSLRSFKFGADDDLPLGAVPARQTFSAQ